MAKEKLTLYVEEEVSAAAHQIAKTSGRSISAMVEDFLKQRNGDQSGKSVPKNVSRWIGFLRTKKTYRQLRKEHLESRRKRYEGSD